jgi:nucleoid-associated protein YgaU
MGGAGILAVLVIIALLVESLYRISRIELLLERQRTAALSSLTDHDDRLRHPPEEEPKPDQSSGSMPSVLRKIPKEANREEIRKHPIPPAPRGIQTADQIPVDAPSADPEVADEPDRAKTKEKDSTTMTQPQGQPGHDGGTEDRLAGISPQTPRADDPTVLQANEHLPVPRISVGIESPESATSQKEGSISAAIPPVESAAGLPPAGATPIEPEFWIYNARGGEKFWDIARRFYGAGHYYPVLMEHNPEIGLFSVGAGVRIKILKDAAQAEEILKRIVKSEGNRLIWTYTVMKGDTMESIARKYYNSDKSSSRLLDLNPGLKLQPGKQIRIQLD